PQEGGCDNPVTGLARKRFTPAEVYLTRLRQIARPKARSPGLPQLLVVHRVQDRELLVMKRRVAAEGQASFVFPLNLHEQLFVFRAETIEQVRMNNDFDL